MSSMRIDILELETVQGIDVIKSFLIHSESSE